MIVCKLQHGNEDRTAMAMAKAMAKVTAMAMAMEKSP